MSLWLLIGGWYVLGVFGCVLATWIDYNKGEDVTLHDVYLTAGVSVTGPIILLFAVIYFFENLRWVLPTISNKVLIKAKR